MMPTNNKLVKRGTQMIMDELKVTAAKAEALLKQHGNVRKAVEAMRKNNRSTPRTLIFAPIMPKRKLQRFAEFRTFDKTFEFPYELKGKWKQDVFKNDHPLVLELGCGKGEYTVALASHYPDKNFLGMDIKSNRMCVVL